MMNRQLDRQAADGLTQTDGQHEDCESERVGGRWPEAAPAFTPGPDEAEAMGGFVRVEDG